MLICLQIPTVFEQVKNYFCQLLNVINDIRQTEIHMRVYPKVSGLSQWQNKQQQQQQQQQTLIEKQHKGLWWQNSLD
jgi:hypothetical protein